MATLQVRLDDQLRMQAQHVANHMGLDLSAAVRLFLIQMVTENGLPFKPHVDLFYGFKNQERLSQIVADMDQGKNCAVRGLIED